VANHLRLDLHLVELLARVDTNDAANHLGDDNHVTEVSLDGVGLLVGLGLLLSLAELLDETHGTALQATVDPAASAGVDDIAELVGGKVEEAIVREEFMLASYPFDVERSSKSFRVGRSVSEGMVGLGNSRLQIFRRYRGALAGRIALQMGSKKNVLVKLDTAVRELAESSSLLELGGLLGVLLCDSVSLANLLRATAATPVLHRR